MSTNTEFSEIYHIFLNSIQDYHLKNLFRENFELGEDLLETFLIKAIAKFHNCPNIEDVDTASKEFNFTLSIKEKNILSELMVISWVEYNINDIVQMELNLNDNDFKHYSEEKNLKEKREYADKLREIASQDMTDYGLANTNFKQWAVGDYGL